MSHNNWFGRPTIDETLTPFFTTKANWNYTGYSNPEVDELLAKARSLVAFEDRKPRTTEFRRSSTTRTDGGPVLQELRLRGAQGGQELQADPRPVRGPARHLGGEVGEFGPESGRGGPALPRPRAHDRTPRSAMVPAPSQVSGEAPLGARASAARAEGPQWQLAEAHGCSSGRDARAPRSPQPSPTRRAVLDIGIRRLIRPAQLRSPDPGPTGLRGAAAETAPGAPGRRTHSPCSDT